MNNKIILFIALSLLLSGSALAALGDATWTSNNQASLTITNGMSAQFEYRIQAVTSKQGMYTISLYSDAQNAPLITYFYNEPTVNNGANGYINVTPSDYGSEPGSYKVAIMSSDDFSNDYYYITLNVMPSGPGPTPINLSCNAVPMNGYAPLNVSLTATVAGGSSPYTFSWSFGDGNYKAIGPQQLSPDFESHVYDVGSFSPSVSATDANGNTVSVSCQNITVMKPTLLITSINCFPRVIDGANQSCSIELSSGNNLVAGGASVDVYYTNGVYFASCTTDNISSACSVQAPVNGVGNYTLYATAQEGGYNPDNDTYPRYSFEVFGHRYNIINLATYNDSNFMTQSSVFYRGQPLYVKFQVYDPDTNTFVGNDIVTAASLVSNAGGRADLSRLRYIGNWYYYDLSAIPTTHEFLGSSNVFAFAFNFTDNTGGQAEVGLTILNNVPIISHIPDQYVDLGQTIYLNLNSYGHDVEDSTLNWQVLSASSIVDTSISPSNYLAIIGKSLGEGKVALGAYDLDTAYGIGSFNVFVVRQMNTSNITASCIASPTSGNAPLSVALSVQASGGTGNYTYSWDYGDGNSNIAGADTSRTYNSAGTYTPVVVVTDTNGASTTAVCSIIDVGNITPPEQNLTVSCDVNPKSGTVPLGVVLSASVSGGNSQYTYSWDFGDGNSTQGTSASTAHYYNQGTYYPNVDVTDSNGAIGSSSCGSVEAYSGNITVLNVSIGGPYNGFINEAVTFDASNSTGAITEYDWTFGDGTSAITTTSYTSHTYSKIDVYNVGLTVKDVYGRSESAATIATIIEHSNYKNQTNLYPGDFSSQDRGLVVKSLILNDAYDDPVLLSNDDLSVEMIVKNEYNFNVKNTYMTLEVPELGIEATSSSYDIGTDHTQDILVTTPIYDASPGTYYVRIVVGNGLTYRVLYRYITIQ